MPAGGTGFPKVEPAARSIQSATIGPDQLDYGPNAQGIGRSGVETRDFGNIVVRNDLLAPQLCTCGDRP